MWKTTPLALAAAGCLGVLAGSALAAGVASGLKAGTTVNPFDVYGQAQAINTALTMPAEERRSRIEGIRGCVRERDLAAWIAAQLADLDRLPSRVTS